jgi:hypothetical protein
MRLDVEESSMQVNIDDPIEDPHKDSLTGGVFAAKCDGKAIWTNPALAAPSSSMSRSPIPDQPAISEHFGTHARQ